MTAQPPYSHRLNVSVGLLALAPFLSLSGCAYIGGAIALAVSGGSSSSTRAANQEPSVNFVVQPIPQPADLVATVDYILLDLESNPIDITIEFSTDNGSTWAVAMEGPGGDGTQGVSSSAAGTPHVYAWDFFSDLFSSDFTLLQTSSFDVTLRFTSDDGVTRATPMPQDTVSFRVGNFPPVVSLDSITSTPLDLSAEIRYTLIDDFSDPLDLLIEFSLDDFATVGQVATQLVPPSPGCPDGTTGLVSSPAGDLHCFEWDFPADLLTAAEDVKVRLTATDSAFAASNPATSSPFRVGNDAPILLPGAVDTQFGVSVDFTLLDSTNDTVSIFVEYSLDDGITYLPAVNIVGSVAGLAASDQGTPHNIAWNALPDVGLGTFNTVLLQITPTDQYGAIGAARATNTFSLVNTDRPFVFITSPRTNDLVSGPVTVDHLLVDFDSDPMVSILVEYRAAGAPTFVMATEGTGGDGTTNLTTSPAGTTHTFVWDTSTDLPNQDVSDAELRITPTDTTGVGTAALGGPYRVDNNVEPTIQNISTPASPATQDIAITYDIVDPEGDSVDILVQFSTDGGVTFPDHAHQPASGSDGIRGLSSSPGGTTHFFAWDSLRDLGPVTENMVALRITPMDNPDPALGMGIQDATAVFTVDNFPATAPPTIDTISPSQGPSAGLNPAIVTGTGFLSGTTVMIGTQPLTNPTIISVNTITGDVPPYISGPTVVDVTVTSPNGSATLAGGYAYIGGAAPCMITIFGPNLGTVGGGTTVTIGGSNFRPGAALPTVTFGGVPATVDAATTDIQIICTTGAFTGPATVDLDITNSMGDMCQSIGGYTYDIVGILDTSFDGDHFLTHASAAGGTNDDAGSAIALDAMGRILVTGFSWNPTDEDMAIWRFNPDGTLDTTFNGLGFVTQDGAAGGADTDTGNAILVEPSGRILVAGTSASATPFFTEMVIWAVNPDGTFDTSFNLQGWVTDAGAAGGSGFDIAYDITLDGSGRILAAGTSNGAVGSNDMVIWRYNPDGTKDLSFGLGGVAAHHDAAGGASDDSAFGIAQDASGRIITCGWSVNASFDLDMVVWVYTSTGVLDTTFNGQGWVFQDGAGGVLVGSGDEAKGVTVDSMGRIIVAGQTEGVVSGNDDMAVWRLNSDGTFDTTFNGQGWVIHDAAGGRSLNDVAKDVALDGSGRILVTGFSNGFGTGVDMPIWRLNTDGTFDTTFNGQGWLAHHDAAGGNGGDFGNGLTLDALGRILVTGTSSNAAFDDDMAIWRYNADGTPGATLTPGPGFVVHNSAAGGNLDDQGNDITLDASGRILVAGSSFNAAIDEDMAIWAYNPDGTLDTTFGSGGFVVHDDAGGGPVFNDIARGIAVDGSGRILAVGESDSTPDELMVIWRYDSNGTLDPTFGTGGFLVSASPAGGSGPDTGRDILLDGSGNILVTGQSVNIPSNLSIMVIWRFDPAGLLDPTFGSGAGFVFHDNAAGGTGGDIGDAITLEPSGRILVTGNSTTPTFQTDMVIWAYNPDGTLDTAFNGQGFVVHDNAAGGAGGDFGFAITTDASGRILVTGSSLGTASNDMVIWGYNPDGTLDTTFGTGGLVVENNAAGGNGNDIGNDITIDAFGRILVTGLSRNATPNNDTVVWRFDSMGTLDTTFGTGGVFVHDDAAGGAGGELSTGIVLDASGKILVTGYSQNPAGDTDMVIWRLE